MAYFLPSFFQKRLLRYALSRLELVDTEALDLDSLGIRWGQRSTVELRDIGLRLEVSFYRRQISHTTRQIHPPWRPRLNFNATTECGILPAGVASIAVNVFLDANIYRPVEATVDSESGSRMQR